MDTTLPIDEFSTELRRLLDNPASVATRQTTIEVRDLLGHTTTWVVQVLRVDGSATAFVQRVNAQGGSRFVIPAPVMAALARQSDTAVTKTRRRAARAAVDTKREAGVRIGNPEALRKARKARGRA